MENNEAAEAATGQLSPARQNADTLKRLMDELTLWPRVVVGIPYSEELTLRAALATKVAKCYALIEAVIHDDANSKHKYSYASAETIYRTVRQGLASVNLAIVPLMGSYKETQITMQDGSGDRRGGYMVVDFDYCLVDGETGYTVVIPWRGEVMEYGDKTFNKAATNATKYMLRTLFLLPTDKDDDPDKFGYDDRTVGDAPQQRPQQPRPNNRKPKGEKKAADKPTLTPEEQDRINRASEAVNIAYPKIMDKDHPLHNEQVALFKEFKEAAKLAQVDYKDILIGAAGTGRASHGEFMALLAHKATDPAPESAPTPETPEAAPEAPKADKSETPTKARDRLMREFKANPDELEIIAALDARNLNISQVIADVVAAGPSPSLADLLSYIDELTTETINK